MVLPSPDASNVKVLFDRSSVTLRISSLRPEQFQRPNRGAAPSVLTSTRSLSSNDSCSPLDSFQPPTYAPQRAGCRADSRLGAALVAAPDTGVALAFPVCFGRTSNPGTAPTWLRVISVSVIGVVSTSRWRSYVSTPTVAVATAANRAR